MPISLDGKRLFITGSTRGLGYACAAAAARAGARVVVHGRTQATVDQAMAALSASGMPAQGGVAFDLADREAIRRGAHAVMDILGGLEGLVHAAGILEPALLPMTDWAGAEVAFRINVLSGLQLGQWAARLMQRNQGEAKGSIIFFSSVMARHPDRGLAVYAATKGALESAALALARELAPDGIRVNTIAPGVADTDMARAAGVPILALRKARIPIGRLTQPSEVGALCAFLLSDAATTLTGQRIGVDGGFTP